jgi:hypothetical protein
MLIPPELYSWAFLKTVRARSQAVLQSLHCQRACGGQGFAFGLGEKDDSLASAI